MRSFSTQSAGLESLGSGMVCGGERGGRGYCGGGEGRVEVGVQVAGELVDLVDEDLDGVVAADD